MNGISMYVSRLFFALQSFRFRSWLEPRLLMVLSLVAILFAAGCGGGTSSSPTPPPQTPPPTPSKTAQGTVGQAGGTVAIPGGAQVVIPQDALAADTMIGVEQGATGAPSLPAGAKPLGPIVAFTPHGTGFALPATMTVPFDPSSVPAGTKLAFVKTNDTQSGWEVVGGSIVNGNTISAPVVGFSFATVLADPNPLDDPPHLVTEKWHYEHFFTGSTDPLKTELVVFPENENADTTLNDSDPPGSSMDLVALHPRGFPDGSFNRVYSNQLGTTFWTESIAPSGSVEQPHSKIGRRATMTVTRVLQKNNASASEKAVVSNLDLSLIDAGSSFPISHAQCPWSTDPGPVNPFLCGMTMVTQVGFKLDAWYTLPNGGIITLRHVDTTVRLNGWAGNFDPHIGSSPDSDQAFSDRGLEVDRDFDEDGGHHAVVRLTQTNDIPSKPVPYVVDIPLDTVPTGGQFNVQTTLTTLALNRRQFESFAGAVLQDPAQASSVQFVEQGVEVVRAPVQQTPPTPPAPPAPLPAPACTTGTDPEAGVIQFEEPVIDGFEQAGATALVRVARSGGSKGAVSVLFSAQDVTARTSVDYTPVTTVVRFEDGEEGARLITIPLIDNDTADGDRSALLSLTQPMGCATLGSQATATLVIHDDDTRTATPTPTFHIGGTVTGLTGTGLTLKNTQNQEQIQPANGSFTFPTQLQDGAAYNIIIATQPSNPTQVCSIQNGSGTIANADVTNINIDCVAPQPGGSLDPTFGSNGIATFPLVPAKSLALQSDGKLVIVGGMTLSRYNPDGTMDTAFGTGGKVTIVANGGPFDAMEGVAIQSDGKIVVAGHTSKPPSSFDDFVVARFNPDGSTDTSFGTGGMTITDFAGSTDDAFALAIQSDGKIVVAGRATLGSITFADGDFAVARYQTNGDLDGNFGNGGKVTTNIGGPGDVGTGVAIQTDGKIVVVGRTASSGGSNPDFAVVRYLADGSKDTSFTTNFFDFFGVGESDNAEDVAIQSDGKIVIGGSARFQGTNRYALARMNSDGTFDQGFGTGGFVNTNFSGQDDFAHALAIQADGKIVVAGQVSSPSRGDFGIARYLPDGTQDHFSTGGIVQIDFFGGFDAAFDVVIQPDGKIVAVGSAVNGTGGGLAIARIVP